MKLTRDQLRAWQVINQATEPVTAGSNCHGLELEAFIRCGQLRLACPRCEREVVRVECWRGMLTNADARRLTMLRAIPLEMDEPVSCCCAGELCVMMDLQHFMMFLNCRCCGKNQAVFSM